MKIFLKVAAVVVVVVIAAVSIVCLTGDKNKDISSLDLAKIILEKAEVEGDASFLLPDTVTDKNKILTKAEMYGILTEICFCGDQDKMLDIVGEGELSSSDNVTADDAEKILIKLLGSKIADGENGNCFTALSTADKYVQGNLTVIVKSGKVSLSNVRASGTITVLMGEGSEVAFEKGTTANAGIFIFSKGEAVLIEEGGGVLDVTLKGNFKMQGNLTSLKLKSGSKLEMSGDVVYGMIEGSFIHKVGSFGTLLSGGEKAEISLSESSTGNDLTIASASSKTTMAGKVKNIKIEAASSVVTLREFSEVEVLYLGGNAQGTNLIIEKRAVTGEIKKEDSPITVIDNRTPWDGRR